MKALLTTLAVIEFGAGLGMLAIPSFVGEILLGSPFGTAIEPVIARVAGIALLALAVACWLLRNEGWSRATRGMVGAMLLYNGGGTGVLLYAGPGLGLYGTGFWPAVLVHAVMAVWCLVSLLSKPARIRSDQ